MGWVSLLEDTLERIQDNIRLVEESLRKRETYAEEHRISSLRALGDAKAILAQAWEHLELATCPELDYAYAIKELEGKIKSLEIKLESVEGKAAKYEYEAANYYAELQDAKREIKALDKEKRKLEKQINRMAHANFGSAVEVFSSPGMIKKHKPNA